MNRLLVEWTHARAWHRSKLFPNHLLSTSWQKSCNGVMFEFEALTCQTKIQNGHWLGEFLLGDEVICKRTWFEKAFCLGQDNSTLEWNKVNGYNRRNDVIFTKQLIILQDLTEWYGLVKIKKQPNDNSFIGDKAVCSSESFESPRCQDGWIDLKLYLYANFTPKTPLQIRHKNQGSITPSGSLEPPVSSKQPVK